MDPSDIQIEHFKKIKRQMLKRGKPEQEFKKYLNASKASLALGREFLESVDSYLNRRGLRKFWDWDG